jgi:transcriptional regulator with XRE-family HTH domain
MKNAPATRPKRLAEKLRQIRLALGLSQSEMLDRLGFSEILFRGNISQYELGRREPPLMVLLAYAETVNVYVESLIKDSVDLPQELPSQNRHAGVERATPSKRKRNALT